MKQFILIVLFTFSCTFLLFGGLYYMMEIRPCIKYGEMMSLESKSTGKSCYVKRGDVWIDRYYNDRLQIDSL